MTGTQWAIGIACAYFAGSIPFGVLIAKTKGVNIREQGSKNIGATNVGRTLGKTLGLVCFFLDVLKGALPVLVIGLISGLFGKSMGLVGTTDMLLWICVAFASLLGHMYSPWLRFGGGKGVATTFGGMVAMWPLLTIPVLLAFFAWAITLKVSKMISLASLVAAIVLFGDTATIVLIGSTLTHAWPLLAVTGLIAIMVFWKHRSNIGRILRGEEPKVGSAVT
ncbi:MAG: glycerol-3-phosphate 1-O-acyltransferase PlsY [Phycisphaerales bacterium]|jgi:glycerol-3-phosphate acyltransferase PlsY|nr:glycerol-3-phosphate 1-O-acyltransferase PlsY [Phycisphaerales bacterium]